MVVPTDECAKDMWTIWSQIIESPDAERYLQEINQARVALHHVQRNGFSKQEMERWLGRWPTAEGRGCLCGRWQKPTSCR